MFNNMLVFFIVTPCCVANTLRSSNSTKETVIVSVKLFSFVLLLFCFVFVVFPNFCFSLLFSDEKYTLLSVCFVFHAAVF